MSMAETGGGFREAFAASLFGSRLLAFLIDYTVALGMIFLATLPLVMRGYMEPVLSFGGVENCRPLPEGPAYGDLVAAFARHGTSALYLVECSQSRWPGAPLREAYGIAVDKGGTGNTETRVAIGFRLDEAGHAGDVTFRNDGNRDLLLFLLPALWLGVLSASGRRSPGKHFAGLKTETEAGEPVPLSRSIRRELLKFAPFILAVLALHLVDFTPLGDRLPTQAGISVSEVVRRTYGLFDARTLIPICLSGLLFLAITVDWFITSLDVRTGQLDYESLSGTRVRRAAVTP